MSHDTTIASSCKDSSSLWSRLKQLTPISSRQPQQITSKSSRIIACLAASGLVLVSAGFGAVYAWSTGSQHGQALACLMVLMAVALELAKPLSVAAAFSAFRSWALVRGAALALMATVAIGYSLQAELSLMATSRGDAVASREVAIKAANDIEIEAQRVRDRYERAKAEYQTLPVSRPAPELQAEIEGLLLTPGADGCTAINGKVTREICPKVTALRSEKARSKRRFELEQILCSRFPPLQPQIRGIQTVGKADPGATALATYLAFFGIVVPASILSEWLVLIGVLALEVGSAFAGLLVQSVAPRQVVNATQQNGTGSNRKDEWDACPEPKPVVQVVHPAKMAVSKEVDHPREKVKTAIVGQLKARGGSVSGGQRGLAKLIGANRSTMRRAMNSLVVAGIVAAEATRNGTVLRLVA